MSAPMVTGAVALLLQQKPDRDLADIHPSWRGACAVTRTPVRWNPVYGMGKLDIVGAVRA
jgi:hypothetical protein